MEASIPQRSFETCSEYGINRQLMVLARCDKKVEWLSG